MNDEYEIRLQAERVCRNLTDAIEKLQADPESNVSSLIDLASCQNTSLRTMVIEKRKRLRNLCHRFAGKEA